MLDTDFSTSHLVPSAIEIQMAVIINQQMCGGNRILQAAKVL